jgi:uncharacterized protein YndB with AHSA1/START domain
MKTDILEIKVAIQIQKPIETVFEAIVNPDIMSNYFISESTGIMEEGKNLVWRFPEFDTDCPIRVDKIIKNQYISYYWFMDDTELLVELFLTTQENNSTLVKINEKSMPNNEAGLKWLSGNSFGWSNFLACLKAYLEYDINLRKGAFDFMKK